MEAHRGGVRVLRVRVAVLGRVRAGRIYADALRGPLCPPRAARDQAVRIVVRGHPGRVRDPPFAHLRLAVGEARPAPAVVAREVRACADVRGPGVRPAHAGGGSRVGRADGEAVVMQWLLLDGDDHYVMNTA